MIYRFDKAVGTGGIGVGMLFHTDDDRTLGRSESRLVRLSGAKDYCKLHIVFHYIAKLLAPEIKVLPVGCVGEDAAGERLVSQMQQCGMGLSYVEKRRDYPTAISVCLQYPDKEGCNFTASNGAGEAVTREYIERCLREIAPNERTVVAAIPEVSLESRMRLLQIGKENGSYCVLSFAAAESGWVRKNELLRYCDLLSVNEEEALSLIAEEVPSDRIPERLYHYAAALNPEITVLVTCGKKGAYVCDKNGAERINPFPAKAVNTSGAGDAFLGGTIAAFALGYPLKKGGSDSAFGETALKAAPEFGAICAGMAVESPDSIAMDVSKEAISKRLHELGLHSEFYFILNGR